MEAVGTLYESHATSSVPLDSVEKTVICSMTIPAGTYLIIGQVSHNATLSACGVLGGDTILKFKTGLSSKEITVSFARTFTQETAISLYAIGEGAVTNDYRVNFLQAIRIYLTT